MRYKIDKTKCMSCGSCMSMCPTCFELDEDGKAKVVGDGKEECKCDARTICPFDAISVLADDDIVLE